jgi:type I restriction enzyme M protein
MARPAKTKKSDSATANLGFESKLWLAADKLRKLGTLIDRVHWELTDADIQKVVSTCHAWRQHDAGPSSLSAKYEDIPSFCKSATTAEIAAHGYVRCVGAEEVEDDGEPFSEKMSRLVAELNAQFAESAMLEAAIRVNLKWLGYGM